MTASSDAPAGGRSRLYGRFIPKEEIDQVAGWAFDEVDAQVQETQRRLAYEAELAAQAPPPAAPVMDPRLLNETREAGFAEGHALGHQEGRAQALAEAEQALLRIREQEVEAGRSQIAAVVAELHQALDGHQQALADRILRLVTGLARQVIRTELSTTTGPLVALVHEASQQVQVAGRAVTVLLNPEDWARLQDDALPNWQTQGWHCVPDPLVAPGGCRVQAGVAQVDADLAGRWQRALHALGLDVPWDEPRALEDLDAAG